MNSPLWSLLPTSALPLMIIGVGLALIAGINKPRKAGVKLATIILSLLPIAPLYGFSNQQLIPAGSLIQCTVSDPKISSKNTAIGDPVLCRISHAERFGSSSLPYYSSLGGRFEDYSDPGRLIGKGWMELRFDRLIVEPHAVIPIEAKVVAVPGYIVDHDGRILGKGHAVRDIVKWAIPILWPIDLLTLPRRGPRPTLKAETRLVVKVMDDLEAPVTDPPQADPYGLLRRSPSAMLEPPAAASQPEYPAQPEVSATYDTPAAAQPYPAEYVQSPIITPGISIVYSAVAPSAPVRPAARPPYRPSPVAHAPAPRGRAPYQPAPIVRPTPVMRSRSNVFSFGASRPMAPAPTYRVLTAPRGSPAPMSSGPRAGFSARR